MDATIDVIGIGRYIELVQHSMDCVINKLSFE